jgi:hypothetical protein
LSKERIEMCEVSQKRVETCETCPKRELKCVKVLEREIDSVHVTRNAAKTYGTCHKKCKQKHTASLEKRAPNKKF